MCVYIWWSLRVSSIEKVSSRIHSTHFLKFSFQKRKAITTCIIIITVESRCRLLSSFYFVLCSCPINTLRGFSRRLNSRLCNWERIIVTDDNSAPSLADNANNYKINNCTFFKPIFELLRNYQPVLVIIAWSVYKRCVHLFLCFRCRCNSAAWYVHAYTSLHGFVFVKRHSLLTFFLPPPPPSYHVP